MSVEAHRLAAARDSGTLSAVEQEVHEAAAELSGLTGGTLKEIEQALEELT
jgi:hypothetical protein